MAPYNDYIRTLVAEIDAFLDAKTRGAALVHRKAAVSILRREGWKDQADYIMRGGLAEMVALRQAAMAHLRAARKVGMPNRMAGPRRVLPNPRGWRRVVRNKGYKHTILDMDSGEAFKADDGDIIMLLTDAIADGLIEADEAAGWNGLSEKQKTVDEAMAILSGHELYDWTVDPEGRDEYDPDPDPDDPYYDQKRFADPGGESALYAESPSNPRIHPCPTCGRENALTSKDVRAGYQCDRCADAAERGIDTNPRRKRKNARRTT